MTSPPISIPEVPAETKRMNVQGVDAREPPPNRSVIQALVLSPIGVVIRSTILIASLGARALAGGVHVAL